MPITADLGGQKYVLGKGRVYFDRFPSNAIINALTQGEGERFLGNAPEFSMSSESEDLDHYASTGGVRTKDASVQLQLDRSGAVTVDNIDRENVALYFLGDGAIVSQASAAGQTSTFDDVRQGRFYQLGATAARPSGHRSVTITGVTVGGDAVLAGTDGVNWQVDEALGRFYIPVGSEILDGDDDVVVTYSVAAVEYEQVVSKTNAIYGAIRFVSDNPYGENTDYYFPYVKMSPDGDYSLIGDEWQQMGFAFEVLKKASNVEAVYATKRPYTP